MQRVAVIAAGLVAGFTAAANAADLPARAPAPYKAPPPIAAVYNWGGFYVGINGGGLEYDHLFMGSRSVVFPANFIAVTRTDTIKQDVDMGTVRINYTFGGPVVAQLLIDGLNNSKAPDENPGLLHARALRPQPARGRAGVGPAKSGQAPAASLSLARDLSGKPLHTPHQVRGRLFPDHALAQLNKPGRCNDEQQARRRGGDEESLRDVHE